MRKKDEKYCVNDGIWNWACLVRVQTADHYTILSVACLALNSTTVIMIMYLRTLLYVNLLTFCSCRFVQMFFLILCGLNVNVTLHVGSFTTSKKGVKTLLFPQTFYELFLNFTRFSLYNFLTNIFTVCHTFILPISGFYFLHSLWRLKVALVLLWNKWYH